MSLREVNSFAGQKSSFGARSNPALNAIYTFLFACSQNADFFADNMSRSPHWSSFAHHGSILFFASLYRLLRNRLSATVVSSIAVAKSISDALQKKVTGINIGTDGQKKLILLRLFSLTHCVREKEKKIVFKLGKCQQFKTRKWWFQHIEFKIATRIILWWCEDEMQTWRLQKIRQNCLSNTAKSEKKKKDINPCYSRLHHFGSTLCVWCSQVQCQLSKAADFEHLQFEQHSLCWNTVCAKSGNSVPIFALCRLALLGQPRGLNANKFNTTITRTR